MAGLSNIFGGDGNQDSSSDGNVGTDVMGDASNTLGLDYNDSNSQSSTNSDGSSDSSNSSHDLSFGSSTDGLLHSVTDAVGMTDESSSN